MQTQALVRTAKGIYSDYNRLHEIPEGAVARAENVSYAKEGAYGQRRGFKRYGAQFQPTDLFEFDSYLFGYSSGTLKYDSDGNGTWVAWDGSWSPPETGSNIRAVQERTALYLTCSTGVYYTEDIDTTPVRAGLPNALDKQVSLAGGASGWLEPSQEVGYRVIWGRLTTYGSLQLGAPSMRETIAAGAYATGLSWSAAGTTVTVTHTGHGFASNDVITTDNLSDALATPSTGTITVTSPDAYTYTTASAPAASGTGDFARLHTVKLVITVPDEVTHGDFYEVYRTKMAASSGDPGDECLRVTRVIVNDNCVEEAAATTTGASTTVTVTLSGHGFTVGDLIEVSDVSAAGLEAGLHTIASVADANTFTYTVAAAPATGSCNVKGRTVIMVDGLAETSISDPLYTNPTEEGIEMANVRPPWCKDLAMWKGRVWYANTAREHYVDLQLVAVSGLSTGTSTVKLTTGAVTETYTAQTAEDPDDKEFKVTTTGGLAENIRETAKSLCRIINRASAYYYAWYTSGIDEAPGIIMIEARSLATGTFYVTANSTATGDNFEPTLPASGTDLESDNDRFLNGIYHSKEGLPHAVPDAYLDDTLGDPSKEILRLIPTRDSLFVVKEDGIFRISGDSERTFVFRSMDLTIFGRAPRTWVALDNAVWGLSTKGVVRVTEAGTEMVSFGVADQIAELMSNANYETLCHAAAYESDGLYLLFAPEDDDDTKCEVVWAFPTMAQTGPTLWRWPAQASIVKFSDQKLYLVRGDTDDHVFVERKDFDDTDYADEELDCEVTGTDTYEDENLGTLTKVTVTFPVTTTLNTSRVPFAGCLFWKSPGNLPYSKIRRCDAIAEDTYDLYLSHYMPGVSTGTGTITFGIQSILSWHPEGGENALSLKRFQRLQLYFDEATLTQGTVKFQTDVADETEVDVDMVADTDHALSLPVPREQAIGRTLQVTFEHSVAGEPWAILERLITMDVQSPEISMGPR